MTPHDEVREAAEKYASEISKGAHWTYKTTRLIGFEAGAEWMKVRSEALAACCPACGESFDLASFKRMGVEVIKLQSEMSALKSSNSEQQLLVETLGVEITRLKYIIAKQLVEEDGLGMEFTYVSILKEELTKAQDEVKRLHDKYDLQNLVKQNDRFREALQKIDNPMKYHHWEEDPYTRAGCFQFVAHEALKGGGDI